MGAAMDDDRDEFVAVGERTDVAAENEDDEDGHVTPIGTDKVPYATIVLESKDLDGDSDGNEDMMVDSDVSSGWE
ncbi:hypothetical protein V6N13_144201 [Hibiscus sabdariffa]